ncbi:MAG: IS630 family transposase [Acidimicrobiales bacterium]
MAKAKRIPKTRLVEYRRDALSMAAEGFSPRQIAKRLHCGRSTIFGWLAQEKAGTLPAEPGMGSGRPPKLTDAQTAKLYRMLFRRPDQYEFDFGLWTRTMVAELIERTFGVRMSVSAVGRMLRSRMGMSPQRPLHQAVERDPVAVARWKAEEFPAIVRRAREKGATIWWQDESGVRTDYHSGTTWAPIGKTPVVIATGKRLSVNMISSVNSKGGLHFRLAEGRLNAAAFIDYLGALLRDVRGNIFLIVDGHPAHKAKKVAAFLATTKGRLEMFFLPGYSPNLNPDEWVWKNIKHDAVGKARILSATELRDVVLRAVARLKKYRAIVRGFFQDPELSYILAANASVQ